jgi:uncharacterized membrane protein
MLKHEASAAAGTPEAACGIMRAMWNRLKTYFLTGLLVLAPVVLTGYVVWRLFVFVDHLLGTTLRGEYIRPGGIPGLGFLTVLVIITATGALANNFLGRSLGGVFEAMVLRVPFLRGLYLLLKEVGEAILSERKSAFQRVVLAPFPGPGVYSIGLVTSSLPGSLNETTGETLEGVFIPHPPNPTTGNLVYYPANQLIATNLRVEQAIKLVVSGGVVMPTEAAVAAAAAASAAMTASAAAAVSRSSGRKRKRGPDDHRAETGEGAA